MFNFPSEQELKALNRQYPAGTRIELIKMDDPYSKLKPGDMGTVQFIDDIGTIFCRWDNGSSLGIVFNEDLIKKV